MNLLKVLGTVSGLTLLSRLVGLVREILMAKVFGASAGIEADAFMTAFRIPNMLRRLFAEGAFSQAFVPLLVHIKDQGDDVHTRNMLKHVTAALFWVLLLITVIGIVAAGGFVYLMASGMQNKPGQFDLTVTLTQWMFPYILLISLTGMMGSILNSYKHFAAPAFAPVLLNLAIIAGIYLFAPLATPHIVGVAWGVLLGGVLQLTLQIWMLKKMNRLPSFSWHPFAAFANADVRQLIQKMLPAMITMSIPQISLVINSQIASYFQKGSIAWISYGDRLMEFPAGLLGAVLGTVLLPSLSSASKPGQEGRFSQLLDWGLRLTFMLALPAAIGLIVFAEPLTALLFHRGKFNAFDVAMTMQTVQGYGVGLIGIIAAKILSPAYYARQDTKTPLKFAMVVLVVTQLFNAILIWGFHMNHAALALSIGLASCVNSILLYVGLRNRQAYQPLKGWFTFLGKIALALCGLTVILWVCKQQFDWIALGKHEWQRMMYALLSVAAAAFAYFATLGVLGFRLKDFKRQG